MLNYFRYFKSIKVARLQINTLAQIPLNLPDSEGEDSKSDNAFEIIELLKAIGNGYNLPSLKPYSLASHSIKIQLQLILLEPNSHTFEDQ